MQGFEYYCDLSVSDDRVCQRQSYDNLDLQRRDISVDGDVFHGEQQTQVAFASLSSGGYSFLNDIQASVSNIMIFDRIFLLNEGSYEDGVVLW